ncbi:hypothetical protein AgCh_021217 [Apium graveolens]
MASWNGQRYFIKLIDDYSRYSYLYLIHEKSQALDLFKEYKVEVELQLNSSIKAIRSDCDERTRGFKFNDPATRSVFKTDNARIFEDVDFGREDIGKSIVFEEDSHDTIYDSAKSNDQIMVPITVQGPLVQENTEIPHKEPIEKTQKSH